MLEGHLQDKLSQIRMWRPSDQITIENPTDLQIVGRGQQGVVFQIDEKRCVKKYYRKRSRQLELRALQLGAKAGIVPEVFFWGDRYIVMEYINAPSLYDYLENHPMTKDLAERIIRLLETFGEVGFNRFDHSGRHIFLLPDGRMKIIDVVHVIKKEPVYFSAKLIGDMRGCAEQFLAYVREISPVWYERWAKHPDLPEALAKANRQT